jgi:hydroxymethylbilane synthase
MPDTLRIGTRGSELALWQTHHVKKRLEEQFPDLAVTIQTIKTTGDKLLDAPLAQLGDKGLFTKELELALLDNRVDIAVHSFKDVPTVLPEGLSIAAVLEREDVRDVFIAHTKNSRLKFSSLPQGATIATGSLRRKCQILHTRPDIHIAEIRGNLNTRIKKLDSSEWSGMILAKAGVTRLGWTQRISDILPFELMLPAVGQGALAIECRTDDEHIQKLLRSLHHFPTARTVAAERAFLHALEGGCQIPIGAYAQLIGDVLQLEGVIGSLDGTRMVRGEKHGTGASAEQLGIDLAQELLTRGGKEILEEIRRTI